MTEQPSTPIPATLVDGLVISDQHPDDHDGDTHCVGDVVLEQDQDLDPDGTFDDDAELREFEAGR